MERQWTVDSHVHIERAQLPVHTSQLLMQWGGGGAWNQKSSDRVRAAVVMKKAAEERSKYMDHLLT